MKAEPPATLIGLSDLKVGLAGSLELPTRHQPRKQNIIGYLPDEIGCYAELVMQNLTDKPIESAGIAADGGMHMFKRAAQAVHREGSPVPLCMKRRDGREQKGKKGQSSD